MGAVRPTALKQFLKKHGFHGIYLVTTLRGNPVKVGITDDPGRRLSDLQVANFEQLRFHRFWWVNGQLRAHRIESSFKTHFAPVNIRGEWFDVSLCDAVEFVEREGQKWNLVTVDDDRMLRLWDHYMRPKPSSPEEVTALFRAQLRRRGKRVW